MVLINTHWCWLNCLNTYKQCPDSNPWSYVHRRIITGFIIPLWSYTLRILNPYRGCCINAIPALSDWAGTVPSFTGPLSCARDINKCQKSAAWTVIITNFRVFWLYFRINSVDKSYRKAIINYLRESNSKIDDNRRNRRRSSTVNRGYLRHMGLLETCEPNFKKSFILWKIFTF